MALRGQDVLIEKAEEVLASRSSVVEEVLIGKQADSKSRVHHETVSRAEVEAGESQMLTQPEAVEYKGYQALIDRAVDVFGDELIASRWLSSPSADLNGDIPLHVAQELGYVPARVQKVFEPIFIRIEHGIYF